MVHLKKKKLPFRTYSKLKMKKFGPYKTLKKHDNGNIFEVELHEDIDILYIFNFAYIYCYLNPMKRHHNKYDFPKKKT